MRTGFLMFAKAVSFGTLAGAGPYLLFTFPMGLSLFAHGTALDSALMALSPLIVVLPFVLGVSVILGLPLTAALKPSHHDRQRTYAVTGLLLGAAIPTIGSLAAAGGSLDTLGFLPFVAVPGMIAGTVTGLVWGKWREALADDTASAFAGN